MSGFYGGRMAVFGILLVTLFSFHRLSAGSEFPELASTTLKHFPPDLRQQVQKAYGEARRNSEDAQRVGGFAMLMHAYEQHEFAVLCYQRARSLQPDSFRWAYYLGVLQALLGKDKAAITALRDAARLDPRYLPARLKLAEALFNVDELEESARLYEAALEEYPELAIPHYGLGRVKAALGDSAAALEHYRKACDLFPAFGAAHYALAMAYRDLGEARKAQEHFSLYQKSKSGRPSMQGPLLKTVKAFKTGARHHLTEAINLRNENRIQESIREHQKALELDPKLVQAHLNLLSLYSQLKNWKEAEEHYRAAIEINPSLEEAHYNYGMLLVDQRRYEEAAAAFRRAVEINPFYADAHNNLGQMLETLGDLTAAEQHYGKAIENGPTDRFPRFNLGRILMARGKSQEAIQQFLRILVPRDEQTPLFMYALASAYIQIGDLDIGGRYARQAKQMADSLGQTELASRIEKELQRLKQTQPR